MTDITAQQIQSGDDSGFSSTEYNSVAKLAELAGISLLKVKSDFTPGFQVGEKTKLSLGRTLLSCGYDDAQSAAHAVFQYFVKGKNKSKDAFAISADYVVVYAMQGEVAPNAAKAFAHNVGVFAAYPYFRALAAHLAWSANMELPPLPTIATEAYKPKN
jgi:hypothetical protein